MLTDNMLGRQILLESVLSPPSAEQTLEMHISRPYQVFSGAWEGQLLVESITSFSMAIHILVLCVSPLTSMRELLSWIAVRSDNLATIYDYHIPLFRDAWSSSASIGLLLRLHRLLCETSIHLPIWNSERDLAFYQKFTAYQSVPRNYQPTDLEVTGRHWTGIHKSYHQ